MTPQPPGQQTVVDLGRLVKQKYPGPYDHLEDAELGRLTKQKYPAYSQFADVEVPESPQGGQSGFMPAEPLRPGEKRDSWARIGSPNIEMGAAPVAAAAPARPALTLPGSTGPMPKEMPAPAAPVATGISDEQHRSVQDWFRAGQVEYANMGVRKPSDLLPSPAAVDRAATIRAQRVVSGLPKGPMQIVPNPMTSVPGIPGGTPPGPPATPQLATPWETSLQTENPPADIATPQWLMNTVSHGVGMGAEGVEGLASGLAPYRPKEQGRLKATPLPEGGGREIAGNVHKTVTGAFEAATPLMLGGGAAAPIRTGMAIGTAVGSQTAVEAGLEQLGLPREYAAVAGDLAGLIGAHYADKLRPRIKAWIEPRLKARFQERQNAQSATAASQPGAAEKEQVVVNGGAQRGVPGGQDTGPRNAGGVGTGPQGGPGENTASNEVKPLAQNSGNGRTIKSEAGSGRSEAAAAAGGVGPEPALPRGTVDAGAARPVDTRGTGEGPAVHGTAAPVAGRPSGEQTDLVVPGEDRSIRARYEVWELADIRPSHHGQTFSPNAAYTRKNERDYSKPENQQRVIENSSEERFNPRYHITDNPDAVNGPVLIDEDGNAIAGNSRSMILQRVYGRDGRGAAGYRALLEKKASQFGIDPAAIRGMKQPVLVRVASNADLEALPGGSAWAIRKTNISGTAALSASERAAADAGQLAPELVEHIANAIEAAGTDATLNDALTGKSGTAIVNRLIAEGFFSEQERPALMDGKTGALTQLAKDRISKALLGQFFRGSDQIQRTPAAIKAKLERIAAPLAKIQGNDAWDLTPAFREAIDLLEYAGAHGIKNLGDVVSQESMFGEGPQWHSDSIRLAELLRDAKPNDLVAAVRRYVNDREPTMFGEATPEQSFEQHFGAEKAERSVAEKAQQSVAEEPRAAVPGARTIFDTAEVVEARARADALEPTAEIHTPKREALRQSIENKLYRTEGVERKKQAYLVTGLPGAGKSTVARPLADETHSLVIDSDLAKAELPEYGNGEGAPAVHVESGRIADRILNRAAEEGLNIVHTILGRSAERVRAVRKNLADLGYDVHLVHVDLPVNEAAQRAVSRFRSEGRFVDPAFILKIGDAPKGIYDILKSEGGFKSSAQFSNDVPRGQQPRLLEDRNFDALRSLRGGGAEQPGVSPQMGGENRRPQGSTAAEPPASEQVSHLSPAAEPLPKSESSLSNRLEEQANAASARIRQRGNLSGRTLGSTALDPQDMIDLSIWGAARIAKGVVDFAAWSEEMVRHFGEAIRPHLKEVFDGSNRWVNSYAPPSAQPAGSSGDGAYLGSGLGALEPLFRAAKAEGDVLKAKRDAALAAVQRAQETPEEHHAGEQIRSYFTAERDLWAARTNQAIDIVARKVLPKIADREALGIMREFRHKPHELVQFLDGTHPFLEQAHGGATNAIDRLDPLVSVMQHALHMMVSPTANEAKADRLFSRIAEQSLQEGRAGGWLESRWQSDEYVPHLINPKGEGEVAKLPAEIGRRQGKIGKQFGFSERRSDPYPTMVHVVADGLIPKTLDVSAAFVVHSDNFARARATHLLEEHLTNSGLGKWGNGKHVPDGWVQLAANNSDEWTKTQGYQDFNTPGPDGQPLIKISQTGLYVPPFIDKALAPITAPDYLAREIPGFATVRSLQRRLKEAILGFSGFHLATMPVMAAADIGPAGMAKAFRAVRESPQFLLDERDLIKSGGTTSIQGSTMNAYRGMRPGTIPTRGEILRAYIPFSNDALKVADALTRLTFDNAQRRFKVVSFALHREAWLADNPRATPEEFVAAKEGIASYVNGVYGGLHWENMGWSRAMVEVARFFMLAPDWSGSNIALGKYAFDVPLSRQELRLGSRGRMAGAVWKESAQARLSRAFWTKQLVGGLIATQMLSLLLSQQTSKRPFQVYLGDDADGREIYQNIVFRGSAGDLVNWAGKMEDRGILIGTGVFVGGKAAPVVKAGIHVITGRNDFGQEIAPKRLNPIANTVRSVGALVTDVSPVPITLRSGYRQMVGDESDKYTWSERFLSLFGPPAQHVAPEGLRMTKEGLREDNEKPQQPILDEIVTGKR